MTPLLNRRGYGALAGPAALQALCNDQGVCETTAARPFSDRVSLAVELKVVVAARVVVLCLAGRPLAVGRRVWAVVIDAVNRSADWAWPHVSVERLERRSPFVAHSNAAPAVVWPRPAAIVVAALFHVAPDFVFAGARSTMSALSFSCVLILPAATAHLFSTAKILKCYEACLAAIADAIHLTRDVSRRLRFGGHDQPSESLTNHRIK